MWTPLSQRQQLARAEGGVGCEPWPYSRVSPEKHRMTPTPDTRMGGARARAVAEILNALAGWSAPHEIQDHPLVG
jgi:hypothetical protein